MSRIFDSEKIRNRVKVEIDKLRDEITDEKQLQLLNEAEESINKEIDDNIQISYLPNQTRQSFTYSLSGWVVCHDERGMWHLYNSIMQIIVLPEIIELNKKTYGENRWIQVKKNLLGYGSIINQIKYDLDRTQDKEWTEKETETEGYKDIYKRLARLPLITKNLYSQLMKICLHTSLGKNGVPTSALDMHRRQYKKIPTYERQKMDYQARLEGQKQQLQDGGGQR